MILRENESFQSIELLEAS